MVRVTGHVLEKFPIPYIIDLGVTLMAFKNPVCAHQTYVLLRYAKSPRAERLIKQSSLIYLKYKDQRDILPPFPIS